MNILCLSIDLLSCGSRERVLPGYHGPAAVFVMLEGSLPVLSREQSPVLASDRAFLARVRTCILNCIVVHLNVIFFLLIEFSFFFFYYHFIVVLEVVYNFYLILCFSQCKFYTYLWVSIHILKSLNEDKQIHPLKYLSFSW
jgi:hypothetical protein